MGVRENKVETYLREKVKLLGGDTRKWVSPGRDGVTDQIVFVCGLIIGVEVKCIDGTLSSVQHREHKRLRDVGMQVVTVYAQTGVDRLIRDISEMYREHNSTRTQTIIKLQQEYR